MFKRTGDLKITAVYNNSNIAELTTDWKKVKNNEFCKTGSSPLTEVASFNWDTDNYLYYRARAITANVPNGNGDRFASEELAPAHQSFVGKGVYYNHDADDPVKAFGVILDSVWSPNFIAAKDTNDSYIEILGAIEKSLIELKRPGLLKQIESGILLNTSMGAIAQRAQCSVCLNIARNTRELCAHMNPESICYIKGRLHNGSLAYEDNFDITFTEDSFVPQPADPTARVFEIISNKAELPENTFKKLVSHFEEYWKLKNAIKIKSSDAKLPPPPKNDNADAELLPSDVELDKNIDREIERKVDQRMRQITIDEIRKQLGPYLMRLDNMIRPEIENKVEEKAKDVKKDLKLPAGDTPKKELPEDAAEKSMEKESKLVVISEDFSCWNPEDRDRLINLIKQGKSFDFEGIL